jgi:hypothetical protein
MANHTSANSGFISQIILRKASLFTEGGNIIGKDPGGIFFTHSNLELYRIP